MPPQMQTDNEQAILMQLATMQQQMAGMVAAMDEMKTSVKDIVAHERVIAELSIHMQQAGKEIATQWHKLDANSTAIDAVDKKADEWINKGRGAWGTLLVLGTFAQAVMLSAMAWVFTHTRTTEDDVLLLRARIEQIEKVKQ